MTSNVNFNKDWPSLDSVSLSVKMNITIVPVSHICEKSFSGSTEPTSTVLSQFRDGVDDEAEHLLSIYSVIGLHRW